MQQSGLMKDYGQLAKSSENCAKPVDFETLRQDRSVHFFNLSFNYFSNDN